MNNYKRIWFLIIAVYILILTSAWDRKLEIQELTNRVTELETRCNTLEKDLKTANLLYISLEEAITEIKLEAEKPEEIVAEEPKIVAQTISENFDILYPSGYTSEQLKSIVSDENRKAMIPYIDSFLKAEETYGVNAFYLLCKLGLESGWGRYESGQNNIAGWTNGKGGYRNFNSVDECIMHVASKLSTTYKEAVGTRLEDVSKRYCPEEGYLDQLMQIMSERQERIKTYGQ